MVCITPLRRTLTFSPQSECAGCCLQRHIGSKTLLWQNPSILNCGLPDGGRRCMTPPIRGGKISVFLFVLYFKLFSVQLWLLSLAWPQPGLCPWTPLGDFHPPDLLSVRSLPSLNKILATPLPDNTGWPVWKVFAVCQGFVDQYLYWYVVLLMFLCKSGFVYGKWLWFFWLLKPPLLWCCWLIGRKGILH